MQEVFRILCGRVSSRATSAARQELIRYLIASNHTGRWVQGTGLIMGLQGLVEIPIAVVLARKEISRSGWTRVHWEGVAALAGERFAAGLARRELIHSREGEEQYLWDGFRLALYRDAAETYWFNLTGSKPSLFIICSEEDGGELLPVSVTADHDQSTSAVESDYKVFAVSIPAEVLVQIEEFVMTHFKPEARRKRKRVNWSDEGQRH